MRGCAGFLRQPETEPTPDGYGNKACGSRQYVAWTCNLWECLRATSHRPTRTKLRPHSNSNLWVMSQVQIVLSSSQQLPSLRIGATSWSTSANERSNVGGYFWVDEESLHADLQQRMPSEVKDGRLKENLAKHVHPELQRVASPGPGFKVMLGWSGSPIPATAAG